MRGPADGLLQLNRSIASVNRLSGVLVQRDVFVDFGPDSPPLRPYIFGFSSVTSWLYQLWQEKGRVNVGFLMEIVPTIRSISASGSHINV